MNSDSFQDRIKALIALRGNVSALAKSAGVSESVVRKWRDGTSEPSRDHLLALIHATGVNIAWLVAGEGPMRPEEGGQEKLGNPPPTQAPQGGAVDKEADREAGTGAVEALLDNRELVAILQLVAALSPDERREIYQVAAEKKRLTDLEEQVADLRSRLKSDSR